jgi:hypothetical protein
VICDTFFDEVVVNEPILHFEPPAGEAKEPAALSPATVPRRTTVAID